MASLSGHSSVAWPALVKPAERMIMAICQPSCQALQRVDTCNCDWLTGTFFPVGTFCFCCKWRSVVDMTWLIPMGVGIILGWGKETFVPPLNELKQKTEQTRDRLLVSYFFFYSLFLPTSRPGYSVSTNFFWIWMNLQAHFMLFGLRIPNRNTKDNCLHNRGLSTVFNSRQ